MGPGLIPIPNRANANKPPEDESRPPLSPLLPGDAPLGIHGGQTHQLFSLLHSMAAVMYMLEHPRHVSQLLRGVKL